MYIQYSTIQYSSVQYMYLQNFTLTIGSYIYGEPSYLFGFMRIENTALNYVVLAMSVVNLPDVTYAYVFIYFAFFSFLYK